MAGFNMNVFQIAVVACALFVSFATSQGHMRIPQPIQGDTDVVGYSNTADLCGVAPGQEFKYLVAQQSPAMSIYPGQTFSFGYVANGPQGFGPLYVRFDSKGVGQTWDYYAQMNNNIAGNNGYLQNSPSGYYPYYANINITVPQNIQCNKNGMCLMQVVNQQAYVSCVYVKLTAAPGTTPTPAPVDPSAGASGLFGGNLVQAKIMRLDALVDILKNLGVDAKVLYQANFNVQDLITRLISVIN